MVTIYMDIVEKKRILQEPFTPRSLIGVVRCEDRRMLEFDGDSHL